MAICEQCGKKFKVKSHTSGRFCSVECYWKSLGRAPVTKRKCKFCGRVFKPKGNIRKFCSHQCYARWLKENVPAHLEKTQFEKTLKMESKICENCGKKFYRPRDKNGYLYSNGMWSRYRFCSLKCAGAAKKEKRITVKCAIYGKEFRMPKCREGLIKTCSKECQRQYLFGYIVKRGKENPKHKRIKVECRVCGKKFEIRPSRKGIIVCCSRECRMVLRARYLSGENNPLWNNGSSYEPYGKEFNNKLKEQVRKRDNYACRECGYAQGQLGYKLPVHHIDYDKTNNGLGNLISLCKSCHAQTNFGREDWTQYYKNMLTGGEF